MYETIKSDGSGILTAVIVKLWDVRPFSPEKLTNASGREHHRLLQGRGTKQEASMKQVAKTLNMNMVGSSETSAYFFQSTRLYVPEFIIVRDDKTVLR